MRYLKARWCKYTLLKSLNKIGTYTYLYKVKSQYNIAIIIVITLAPQNDYFM